MKYMTIPEVIDWLKERKELHGERYEDIAREAVPPLSYQWLVRFVRGEISQPPYERVVSLIQLIARRKGEES